MVATTGAAIFPIGNMPTPPRILPAPVRVKSASDLGAVVRSVRKALKLDQATGAGLAGVGVRFLGDVERGKPTVRLGLALQVLDRLGLEVWIGPRGSGPGGAR